MKASKRSRRSSKLKDDGVVLDAELWGKLQDYIPLQNVYEKLPYQELFRLRLVCKAWNHAALQRLEPKPYFVIIPRGYYDYSDEVYLNGVLSYDVASEEYSFKRQRFPLRPSHSRYEPFEVEGLIFCRHPDNLEQQGVFNIHNKTWHAIPPAPKVSEYRSAIGMMVDTSERPYSFKLVVGSLDTKTQIYDSQSRLWSTTSSRLKQLAKHALSNREIATCMCSNGFVYISVGAEILLAYSMEEDKWTIMDFPEVKQQEGDAVYALGVWEGRIFTTREDCGKRNITVWELVDRKNEKWVKYVVISGADYDVLMECDFLNYGPSIYENLSLWPCFCDGYLLMYNWHYSNCQSYALGMLNLATCEWEKVDLPPRTVAIVSDIQEDYETEEGTDNEEGSEEGSGFEGDSLGSSEEDEDEDSKGEDSRLGCAQAIRIRQRFRNERHTGTDIVRSKLVHHRQIGRCEKKGKLSVDQAAEGAPLLTSDGISAKAEKPSFTVGSTVMKPLVKKIDYLKDWREAMLPSLAAKAGTPSSTIGKIVMSPSLAAKAGEPSASTTGKAVMNPNLAAKVGKSSASTTGKIVMKPSGDYECTMCLFDSDVPEDYEAHKKTKVHRLLEELRKVKKFKNPLVIMNEYVSNNQVKVDYRTKQLSTGQYEVIAIFQGTSDGTAGLPIEGFGRNGKSQRAKHMAAADVLERIIENVSEPEFTNMAKNGFVIGSQKRKSHGGKPGGSDGSGKGVGRGSLGGSRSGVGGAVGDLGDTGGGSVSVGGGNPGDSAGSGKGVSEGGGNLSGNGGSCRGVGGGGGSYPSNPNAIPIMGYNNYSSRAGSLSNDVVKYTGQGGTSYNMLWQGGCGRLPSHPEIFTQQKFQNLTESYLDRIQGGRGYIGGGYGGQRSLGRVGIGGDSYGGQDVRGNRYISKELPDALGYGGRELHPGISLYGQHPQGSLVPHGILGQTQQMPIQSFSVLSQHLSSQHTSTQHVHVQTQHNLMQHVHSHQGTMWITTAGGPGQGGTPYPIYEAGPQPTVGVATGAEQMITHTYNHQYAPPILNYNTSVINQEYGINAAFPVEEMAPGTSNATKSTWQLSME